MISSFPKTFNYNPVEEENRRQFPCIEIENVLDFSRSKETTVW